MHTLHRLYLFEPRLVGWADHHLHYVLRLGTAYTMLAGSHPFVIPGCSAREPVKSYLSSLGFLLEEVPSLCSGAESDVEAVGESFCLTLSKLDSKYAFSHQDLLIVTSAGIAEIEGAKAFLNQRNAQQHPNIALIVHRAADVEGRNMGIAAGAMEWSSPRLRCPTSARQFLSIWTAPVKALSQAVRTVTDLDVGSLPVPFAPLPESHNTAQGSADRIVFGTAGGARGSKGLLSTLIVAAEPSLDAENVGFILHLAKWERFRQKHGMRSDELLTAAEGRPNVRVILKELPPDEYATLLSEMDVMLIPYSPRIYHNTVSSVFVTAAAAAKPVITSPQSWMAAELLAGHAAGVVLDESDPASSDATVDALLTGVRTALRCIDRLRHNAKVASEYYRTHWSAEVCLGTITSRHALCLARQKDDL